MDVVSEAGTPEAFPHRGHTAPPLQTLQERVRRLSGGGDPGSSAAKAALLLLAGLHLEHNVVKLARYTRLEVEFVARCARRLVDNGVWAGGRTVGIWSPEGAGREAFWADVAVAEGKLCRRLDEEGRPQWAPGGHWWKSFDLQRNGDVESSVVYHSPPPAPAELPTSIYEEEDADDADEGFTGEELVREAAPALAGVELSASPDEAPESAEPESPDVNDGNDADDEFVVQVTSDRPASRNRSAVDLFPDAVWL